MQEVAQTPLAAWQNFYVIVGSSSAALTGLQFVVIALVADLKRRSIAQEIDAFGTPTVVYFSTVLLVSAISTAPWQVPSNASLAIGACGIAGLIYSAVIIKRLRRLSKDRVMLKEEWLWYILLPLIVYALLLIAAVMFPGYPRRVTFLIGFTVLLLLFVGIHNAWDTVTFIAVSFRGENRSENPD
jgi:hypothetical protein